MDIEDWLRSLGLGWYEQAFRENEIDEQVLPKLTAEEQEEMESLNPKTPDEVKEEQEERRFLNGGQPHEQGEPHEHHRH